MHISFTPRRLGDIYATLTIFTKHHGTFKLPLFGTGLENIYRIKPLKGIAISATSRWSGKTTLYNPGNTPISIRNTSVHPQYPLPGLKVKSRTKVCFLVFFFVFVVGAFCEGRVHSITSPANNNPSSLPSLPLPAFLCYFLRLVLLFWGQAGVVEPSQRWVPCPSPLFL